MRPGGDQATTRRLYNVNEAAEVLGLTVEAVRSRIKRGTLEKEKADDGTVYVVIENGERPGTAQSNDQATAQPFIVERLENEVEWLRHEVERKDTIIMSLSQSIAALEAPSERRESPETPPEDPYLTHAPPTPEQPVERPFTEEERPSWWRRFFGLE